MAKRRSALTSSCDSNACTKPCAPACGPTGVAQWDKFVCTQVLEDLHTSGRLSSHKYAYLKTTGSAWSVIDKRTTCQQDHDGRHR